jgi:hypothetical protein
MVVLPASGCEIIAKVLLSLTSLEIKLGDIFYFPLMQK